MQHTDKYGRATTPGRNRTAEHANVRCRSKFNRPLPLALACHPKRARPTYAPHGKVVRSFPQYEALTQRTLERRLATNRPRQAPYYLMSMKRGYLGWTGDYGLALTLMRKGAGDIYWTKGE